MKAFVSGSISWITRSLRWFHCRTSRQAFPLLLLAHVCMILLLAGCTTFRRAGGDAAQGAAEWLASPAGRAAVGALVDPAIEAGRKMLADQYAARMAEIERKVQDGTATAWQIALYLLAGGSGAGATGKLLERFLIGKRQPTA